MAIANEEDVQKSLEITSDISVENESLDLKKYQAPSDEALAAYPNMEMITITLQEIRSADWNVRTLPE